MKPIFVTLALLWGFFALGRLSAPDPDGSGDAKSDFETRRMLAASRGRAPLAVLHRLSLVLTFWLPYWEPEVGIAGSMVFVAAALAWP